MASKSGLPDDCASESGFIEAQDGGRAISIMLKNLPEIGTSPETGESLVSTISPGIYAPWAPLFERGQTT